MRLRLWPRKRPARPAYWHNTTAAMYGLTVKIRPVYDRRLP